MFCFTPISAARRSSASVDIAGLPPAESADLRHRLTTLLARLRGAAIRTGKTYNRSTLSKATNYVQSRLAKNLSVNNVHLDSPGRLSCQWRPDLGEDAAQDGTDQIVDGIGCIVGQGRALDSGGQTDAGAEVSAQAGSRAQAHAGAASLLGHRLRTAHRHSVEGVASGVRLGERGAPVLSELAEGGVVPQAVAGRTGRI